MDTTTRPVSNADDIIATYEIAVRIDELKAAWSDATGDSPDDYALSGDDWRAGLDDDEAHEITALLELAKEGPDCTTYGSTLIRHSYFTQYAQELAEEIGAVDPNAGWPTYCIDWERAARDLRMDYTEVDFDGVSYWVR